MAILKRMETNDDYIPKLCQAKFNLMSSANTKELPGFKELKNKTINIISDIQKHLKVQVIKHTKLEIKAKQEHLEKHFVTALWSIIQAIFRENNITSGINKTIHLMSDHLCQDLLKHSGMLHTEFLTSYAILHNIETMPLYPTHTVPDKSSMSCHAIVLTVNSNNTVLAISRTFTPSLGT
eukprot:10389684-Ditylum_brightwellii.AAC.1